MDYTVNDQRLSYTPTGETKRGDEITLLNHADDLTALSEWNNIGFTIEKLFDEKTFAEFDKLVRQLLRKLWSKAGFNSESNFELNEYHLFADTWDKHLRAINETKLLSTTDFPLGVDHIENRISEICKIRLVAKNPFDNQSVFHFRIVRPGVTDNNPLHRDVWLEDYKDCINIYIPIAGSNDKSSLILVPESHRWPESSMDRTISGAVINGVKFNVPAVTAIHKEYKVQRPNPGRNEVLVFSPYLIHGGAVNLNADDTRISIEMRFWRKR
jgi:hypothetical protein